MRECAFSDALRVIYLGLADGLFWVERGFPAIRCAVFIVSPPATTARIGCDNATIVTTETLRPFFTGCRLGSLFTPCDRFGSTTIETLRAIRPPDNPRPHHLRAFFPAFSATVQAVP